MLGQVEPEVQRDLEQHEHDDRRRRGAGHADRHRADDDRDVHDDQPAVRREHLRRGRGPQVLAPADVVEDVRHPVADEQADEHEGDRQRVQRRPEVRLALGAREREQGERQDEEAVDDPEDAVMHDEERDQGRLVHAARRAAVDPHATQLATGLAHRFRRRVLRPLGATHLQDVEQPVDAVLQPVDDQDSPDVPAEPQHAGEWDQVGDDQRDDRADRRADPIPGDEALHAPDAIPLGRGPSAPRSAGG